MGRRAQTLSGDRYRQTCEGLAAGRGAGWKLQGGRVRARPRHRGGVRAGETQFGRNGCPGKGVRGTKHKAHLSLPVGANACFLARATLGGADSNHRLVTYTRSQRVRSDVERHAGYEANERIRNRTTNARLHFVLFERGSELGRFSIILRPGCVREPGCAEHNEKQTGVAAAAG